MGYEIRKRIYEILKNQPGTNACAIAKAIGLTREKINNDIIYLRKTGIVRREGKGRKSVWHINEGQEMPLPETPGRKFNFTHNSRYNICAYHSAGGKRTGYCYRCIAEENPLKKRNHARLKRAFPRIFSEGAA
jgi:hypothetical protein